MGEVVNVIKPSVIVLFGITGDLAKRKIMPALYHLFKGGHVHRQTYIIGTSRQTVDELTILDTLRQTLAEANALIDESVIATMQEQLQMVQLDPAQHDSYGQLTAALQELDTQCSEQLARFYYLSLPPQVYPTVIECLGHNNLQTNASLLIEKPFGHDLESAQQLIQATANYFDEHQVFRIDHYLAKETAQNILTFRSQNPLFSSIWNNRHISKVSITAAESIGIEGRVHFYDDIGALRDVVQSHLLQLLAVTLMDIPSTPNADTIHAAKQAVLDTIAILEPAQVPERVVRGQYRGYGDEIGKASTTETFVSLRLESQVPAWQGTELKLTTGKSLKLKRTSITVDFGGDNGNRLQFRIQPNEGITLNLQVKQPGLATDTTTTALAFDYQTNLPSTALDAYERVLIDAMRGDRTLFATDQEVLASWRIVQPILDSWQQSTEKPILYEPGSDGPPC